MPSAPTHKPALLVVLDGFAWGEPGHPCNAVDLADTPTFDRLRAECPNTNLECSGEAVGLPKEQMGNSEVGHMNIGAGRVVLQDFMRINAAIEDETFGDNEAYQSAFDYLRKTGGALHLIGLLGPGGVHAHESHFGAALHAAADAGIDDVLVHPIGDGRDTPPQSAHDYLKTLDDQLSAAGVGRIASFVGRYYAMDRDRRWDRVEAAYNLYVHGKGHDAYDPHHAVQQGYDRGETDEFVQATVVGPPAPIRDGDAVVWLNFRPDRSRQMTRAVKQPDFAHFDVTGRPDVAWVCTALYDSEFANFPGLHVAYPPNQIDGTLAEHIAALGLSQYHTAETEKYAHVTYFLNGGREEPWPGETRSMVQSPKVATYDLQPEMSAKELTDTVLAALGSGDHDLVVVNYANLDMVGHTGVLEATVEAVAFVDHCMDALTRTATELGYVTLITSDHGNAEDMCDLKLDGTPGTPRTKHSMFPSPLIVVNAGTGVTLRDGGALANVAPTLLDLMGLEVPAVMTAGSLVDRA